MRLKTFGGLWLERADGSRVSLGPKALGLLAVLAAAGARPVSRDRLMLLLWPESDEERARRALNQVLYRIRQDLGADPVQSAGPDLRLDPAVLTSDVGEFLAADPGRNHERMAELYSGAFLDGVHLEDAGEFERWGEGERHRLRAMALAAVEALARAADQRRDHPEARRAWRRLADLDPLNSRATVGLMAALAASGDRAGAIREADVHQRRLGEEIGAPPDQTVAAFADRLRRGDWASALTAPEPPLVVDPGVAATPASAARISGSWPRRWGLALGALGFLALVAWGAGGPGNLASRVAPGAQVLLADIRNTTGDSTFDRALFSAATIGLQQSPHVRLFPRTRVRETLVRMGRPGADSLFDETLAREVAVRENLASAIVLDISRLDSTYLLGARLLNPVTGEDRWSTEVRVTGRGRILAGLDELLDRTRRALGESRAQLRSNDVPLPVATTASLEALQAYARGLGAWTRRDYLAARSAWSRAIELDSSFALAHASLADYYWFLANDRPQADASIGRALAHLDRLTEREELRIRIGAARIRGHQDAEVELARQVAERYPSRDSWFNLATSLMRERRCREAYPAFRRALDEDSLFTNGWINLATCYQLDGELQQALDAYARAERTDSTVLVQGNLNHEWGTALVRVGRLGAADSAFRRILTSGAPGDRARGYRSLAYLAMYRGRYREASAMLSEAASLTQQANIALSTVRNRTLHAEVLLTLGDGAGARRELAEAAATAAQTAMSPMLLLYLGHATIRLGESARARAILARLDSTATASVEDVSSQRLFRGLLLLAEGRAREAVEAVREDRHDALAPFRLSILAEAFDRLGYPDSAMAAAARSVALPYFGIEPQDEWQRAPLQLARIAEEKGDLATARAAYSRYLERFEQGDPDLPEVLLARRNLARLQTERAR